MSDLQWYNEQLKEWQRIYDENGEAFAMKMVANYSKILTKIQHD